MLQQTNVSLEDAGLSLQPLSPRGRGEGGQPSARPTGFQALQQSGTRSSDTQTSQEMSRVLVLSGNSNSRPANAISPTRS